MFSTLQFVALAVVASFSCIVTAQVPNCARNYTVRLGDTCDLISAALNVSTFQLAHVNNATIDASCDNLALGEPLCLGVIGQDCTTTHVVQSGDACDVISGGAGIDTATLLANNPNVNVECSNIYPGEVLCTASQVIPYN